MGVDRRDYIILGYKLAGSFPKDNNLNLYEDEKLLPYIEGHKGIEHVIMDRFISLKKEGLMVNAFE